MVDVLVIGAGPAGSAAARLLAAWGHQVVLVDRPADQSSRLAVSIPPSAQKVLSAIGALPAVEDAGFIRWRGNTVWWAGERPRTETFAPGTAGYQVQHRVFDACLRRLAADAGATFQPGVVKEIVVPDLDDGRPSRDANECAQAVLVVEDGREIRLGASWVLDCSGRTGIVARRGLRVSDPTPRTVALAAVWQADAGWPVDDESHTLVASYEDGWAWSVPTAPGVRQFAVMVDPERTGLTRGVVSRDVYLAELGKVKPFTAILEHARLIEKPWGADASTYHASRYAGPGWLLVGDAASTIDPLSSFGVKKALVSGWLAAIVVHTALERPDMRDAALAFFDRRERALHASATSQAVSLAAAVAGESAHPFWLSRAAATDESDAETGPDPSALSRDPAVVAAFDELRRRPAISLRPTPALRVAPRAAVGGQHIVLEDHLFLPEWPEGVRYLRGVDLVGLVELAPAFTDVGDLYHALAARSPAARLPDFLGALAVLLAKGALAHQDEPGV